MTTVHRRAYRRKDGTYVKATTYQRKPDRQTVRRRSYTRKDGTHVKSTTYERPHRKLCKRGEAAAKAKYQRWPSAYASGYAVQVCQGKRPDLQGRRKAEPGFQRTEYPTRLGRWFEEKWVDICAKDASGNYKPCGRSRASSRAYPYCRPTNRISAKTPRTWKEMSPAERRRMCKKKTGPKRVYVS